MNRKGTDKSKTNRTELRYKINQGNSTANAYVHLQHYFPLTIGNYLFLTYFSNHR